MKNTRWAKRIGAVCLAAALTFALLFPLTPARVQAEEGYNEAELHMHSHAVHETGLYLCATVISPSGSSFFDLYGEWQNFTGKVTYYVGEEQVVLNEQTWSTAADAESYELLIRYGEYDTMRQRATRIVLEKGTYLQADGQTAIRLANTLILEKDKSGNWAEKREGPAICNTVEVHIGPDGTDQTKGQVYLSAEIVDGPDKGKPMHNISTTETAGVYGDWNNFDGAVTFRDAQGQLVEASGSKRWQIGGKSYNEACGMSLPGIPEKAVEILITKGTVLTIAEGNENVSSTVPIRIANDLKLVYTAADGWTTVTADLTVGGEHVTPLTVTVCYGDALPIGYTADGKYIIGWTANGEKVTQYTDDIAAADYTAAFVDTKMLTVKTQDDTASRQAAEKSLGCRDIRFIGSVDSTDYAEAGFVLSLKNTAPTVGGSKVVRVPLERVYASVNEAGVSTPAAQVYDAYSQYLFAYELKEIPVFTVLYVRAYVKLADGTYVYGDCRTVNCPLRVSSGMDRTRLNIGAYYLGENARTEQHIKEAAECGIDYFVKMQYDPQAFDLLEKYHIGAIMSDQVPGWVGGNSAYDGRMAELQPISEYESWATNFCGHPAIWGIEVADEPYAADLPYAGQVMTRVQQLFKNCFAFINLYPNYASTALLGTDTYAEYLAQYSRSVTADYVCYDNYLYQHSVNEQYENLRLAADTARSTGRSLWTVLQANSFKKSDYMDYNQFRFQAYSAMTFGAENLLWACYAPGSGDSADGSEGWGYNQILDVNGNKTVDRYGVKQYDKLKEVNTELHRIGKEYMRYRNVATHFVGFTQAALAGVNQQAVAALTTDTFADVQADNGSPLLIGEMVARAGNGAKALMICAADDYTDTDHKNYRVTFRADGKTVIAMNWDGWLTVQKHEDGSYSVPIYSNGGVLLIAY